MYDELGLPSLIWQLYCLAQCHAALWEVAGREGSDISDEGGDRYARSAVNFLSLAVEAKIPKYWQAIVKDYTKILKRDIKKRSALDTLRDRVDFQQLLESFSETAETVNELLPLGGYEPDEAAASQ